MKIESNDFIVEELPLYEPSRVGTHTFFVIRKQKLSTFEVIDQIAHALHVNPRNFGYAGLKDKYAVTTQMLSVEGVPPEQVLRLTLPAIEILWAERHPHKLRVGHLRGNRFEITLRDVPPTVLLPVEEKMAQLAAAGVPNRFGAQRFGNKHDSHLIGKALIKAEWDEALHYVLSDETTQFGELAKQIEREKAKGSMEKAVNCIPHRLRKLYLSAYQAYLFNAILEKRLPNLRQLWDGDIAVKHSNSAPFLVESAAVEQPRADSFEISPSGPIFGYKMQRPTGEVLALEMELLVAEGVKPEAFRKVAGIRLPGTRRPLRMSMELHQVKSLDVGLRLCFTLPAGGYATVVLQELKGHLVD